MSEKSLEERIKIIEARLAIQEIHNKYALSMNLRDEDIFMSIWDQDAVWDMAHNGKAIGREAINQLMHNIWENNPKSDPLMGNIIINFTTKGADVVSNVLAGVQLSPEGEGMFSFGTYYDTFSSKDGMWFLASRRWEILYRAKLNDIKFWPLRGDNE